MLLLEAEVFLSMGDGWGIGRFCNDILVEEKLVFKFYGKSFIFLVVFHLFFYCTHQVALAETLLFRFVFVDT